MGIESEIGESAAAVMAWPKVERHAQTLSDASQHPDVADVRDARGLNCNFAVSFAYLRGQFERWKMFRK